MAEHRPTGWPRAPEGVVIRGNGQWRPLFSFAELDRQSLRREFDYLSPDEFGSLRLVKFKGDYYDINDVDGRWPHDHRFSYKSESFFSGLIIQDLDEDLGALYDREPWEWVRVWDYST